MAEVEIQDPVLPERSITEGSDHTRAEVVEAATKTAEDEAKAAGSALLDTIEQTRVTQGDYFYEIGEKDAMVGPEEGRDLRLIAFKTPVQVGEEEQPRTIVVTQDGAFSVSGGTSFQIKDIDGQYYRAPEGGVPVTKPTEEFIKRIKDIQEGKNMGSYVHSKDGKLPWVATHGYGSHESRMNFQLEPVSGEIASQAQRDSIRDTESPFETRVNTAQAKTQTLRSLTSTLGELPPRG